MKKIVSTIGLLLLATVVTSAAYAGNMGRSNSFNMNQKAFSGNSTSTFSSPMPAGQAKSSGSMNGNFSKNGNSSGRNLGGQMNKQSGGRMM